MARTTAIRRALAERQAEAKPLPEFPTPFLFNARDPITLVELRMRKFSGMIRSKPNWWEKVYDAELVAKWRQEMVQQDRAAVEELWSGDERFEYGAEKKWPREAISDVQLDYIFDELKYEAGQRDKTTGIFVRLFTCPRLLYQSLPSTLSGNGYFQCLRVAQPYIGGRQVLSHIWSVCPRGHSRGSEGLAPGVQQAGPRSRSSFSILSSYRSIIRPNEDR